MRAVIDQALLGEQIVNTFGFQVIDTSEAALQELTDAIANVYTTRVIDFLDNGWTLQGVTWYDADALAQTPGIVQVPTGGVVTGTRISDGLPPQVALLASHVCSGGPPWRGRTYHGGITVNNLLPGGRADVDLLTAFGLFWSDMQTLSTASNPTVQFGVIRLPRDGQPTSLFAPATGTTITSDFATQRRRRFGVGS
jgi:hypothetical protein